LAHLSLLQFKRLLKSCLGIGLAYDTGRSNR